jgi:hypothetical protein
MAALLVGRVRLAGGCSTPAGAGCQEKLAESRGAAAGSVSRPPCSFGLPGRRWRRAPDAAPHARRQKFAFGPFETRREYHQCQGVVAE